MTKSHGSCLSENSLVGSISNALGKERPDAVRGIEVMAAAKKAKKQVQESRCRARPELTDYGKARDLTPGSRSCAGQSALG